MLLNCGVGEDSWESLGLKEIQPVHPKGNQSWIFIGRTDAEAEAPILWPPDEKRRVIVKDPDAGKDGGQEEKGTTEDEMARWHHRLNGYEFEQAPGVGDGQRSLACCSSWGCKELGHDWATELNWNDVSNIWKYSWSPGKEKFNTKNVSLCICMHVFISRMVLEITDLTSQQEDS